MRVGIYSRNELTFGLEGGRSRRSFVAPASLLHALFDRSPDALHYFAISPPSCTVNAALFVPSLDREALNATTPTADFARDLFAAPADVDAGRVLEEFWRGGPLVGLELPGLAGCEDGNESIPVVWSEIGCAVNKDEPGRFSGCILGADSTGCCVGWIRKDAQWARYIQNVGTGHREGGVVGRYKNTILEERPYI